MTVGCDIQIDDPGFVLEFEESYDTDPADLWHAITTPERLARFMATYRGEFKLGGRWQALGRDGSVYCDGEVTACDAPNGFATTWQVRGEGSTLLTVQLEADGARTRLRLRHRQVTRLDYGAGWHTYLERLAAHLVDPTAPDDAAARHARQAELEPEYAARFAAVDASRAGGRVSTER